MATILLLVLIVLLIAGLPQFPHGGFGYGYYPSGILGLLLIVMLILFLAGRI